MGEQQGGTKRKSAESFFQRVRVPMLFGLVTLLVLGVYYFLFVQRRYNYLTGRDFRFLATIGAQMDSSLASHARRFSSLARQKNLKKSFEDPGKKASLLEDTGFEDVRIEKRPWPDVTPGHASIALETGSDDTWISVACPLEEEAEKTGETADPKEKQAGQEKKTEKKEGDVLLGRIKLRNVVEPIFRSRKAFDIVLLADSAGDVIYHQGVADLSVTRLSALVDKSHVFEKTDDISHLLSSSSDSYLVELNGREYRLFVKPVTLPLRRPAGPDSTWLICGLVPKKEFVYQSLAVSSALLSFLLGLLLLALLSWPFLKLKLLGETQRVGIFDLLLLGVCGLLGVSIATLFVLDFKIFGELKETSREQLAGLAQQMEENVRAELRAAYPVLTKLEEGVLAYGRIKDGESIKNLPPDPEYPLATSFLLVGKDGMQVRKGSFNSSVLPLIPVQERDYFQKIRQQEFWDLRDLEDPPANGSASRRKTGDPKPFFVESIVGWTRAGRFAVISKPIDPRFASVKGKVEVAALAIPMISLIDPVLPPGVKFAIVDNDDENGKVLFHSDSERNSTEAFLPETDYDRRLRSAIFARRTETMNIRYWGEDYIASVRPIQGLPWTVIALKDLKTLRGLNFDWLSTTLLFLLLYCGIFAFLLVAIAMTRPSYRAAWIWPDPDHLQSYGVLAISYLLALTGFLLSVWSLRASAELLAVSGLLPALAFVMAYARLQKKHPHRESVAWSAGVLLLVALAWALSTGPVEIGPRFLLPAAAFLMILTAFLLATGRLRLRREWMPPLWFWRQDGPSTDEGGDSVCSRRSISAAFCFCGVLLLFLTAVLPTAGFFEVAQRLHAESFLRHGQLKLAMDLKKREARVKRKVLKLEKSFQKLVRRGWLALDGDPWSSPLKRGLDVYASPFFKTRPDLPPVEPLKEATLCRCLGSRDSGILPPFLEDLLPLSLEHATEMRELVHDSSSDCAWHWTQKEDGTTILHSSDYPDSEIHLFSNEPEPQKNGTSATKQASLFPAGGLFLGSFDSLEPSQLAFAFVSLVLLSCVVRFVVHFVSRKVFLIDLLEPLLVERDETGPSTIGRNLFLVSKGKRWKEEVMKDNFFWFHMRDLEDPDKGWPATRPELVASDRVILVEGFEERIGDREFNKKKLEFLENLVAMKDRTVVVISSVSPARLLSRDRRSGSEQPLSSAIVQRWKELLSAFTISEEDLRMKPADSKKHVARALNALEAAQEPTPATRNISEATKILREEAGDNPHLKDIADELESQVQGLSREQVLEELGERAEGYYQTLWESCTLQEEVVLEHLAAEGLVNEKSRRLIRRLMARGLVRRTPNFRLMNETFRRFVISSARRSEVLSLEKQAGPSSWDKLRGPFFFGLAASITFFFVTQEALLQGIAASITGLTAGLPAVVKFFDLFGEDRPKFLRFGSGK